MCGEIGRGRDGHPPGNPDELGHEARIGDLADSDREVDALLDHVGEAVVHDEIDADLRVAVGKSLQPRHDVQPPEHDRHGEAQRARGLPLAAADSGFGLGQRLKGAQRMFVEVPAILGQRERAGSAGDEARPEMLLQRRDLPADRRLRRVELGRNRREAACFHDADESPHGREDVRHRYASCIDQMPTSRVI